MVKITARMAVVVGVAVVVSSIGLGTTWSYLRTAHSEIGKSLRDTVPITFELKRLERMTQDLIPEIRANQRVAAQLDVEIEYLVREVDQLRQSQTEARARMQKIRGDLAKDNTEFQYGDRRWTRAEVEQDLAHRMDKYQNVQEQLAAKEKLVEARRKTLLAASDKIHQYQRQRDLLVEKAESLQAELNLAEVAQAEGNLPLDQSKLAQAKALATEVEKKIRTLQRVVESESDSGGEIPIPADSRPVTQRFDELFRDAK